MAENDKKSKRASLPSGRKMANSRRDMAQSKADYEGWHSMIGYILIAVIVFLFAFGYINQRKFIETVSDIGTKISETVGNIMNHNDISVTDDGIYVVPNQDLGTNGSSLR